MKQVIRGKVIDQDTQVPIIGANIVVKDSKPFMGASTGLEGDFKLHNVAVGRHTLLISYIGYEGKTLSNLLIGAGKELVLEVGLQESFIEMEAIEVKANKQKAKPINEMALISARSVSVEETKRYAAGISDPGSNCDSLCRGDEQWRCGRKCSDYSGQFSTGGLVAIGGNGNSKPQSLCFGGQLQWGYWHIEYQCYRAIRFLYRSFSRRIWQCAFRCV